MRIDLPGCNLKTCRYSSDGNCVDKNRYNSCEYTELKKPHKTNVIHVIDRDEYYCANCDRNVSNKGYTYCPDCGYELGEVVEE